MMCKKKTHFLINLNRFTKFIGQKFNITLQFQIKTENTFKMETFNLRGDFYFF